MKIVIANDYYFSLKYETLKRYFELKGLGKPYFYRNFYEHPDDGTLICKYKKISDDEMINEIEELRWWDWVSIIDKGEICSEIFDEYYFDVHEMDRQDEILIQVVEELKPTNLKVVEIPDDVKWYIDEPEGGYESVHEEHRSWS